MIAGVWGSIKGLIAFVCALALVSGVPFAMASVANRGRVDIDTFVPRSAWSAPQGSKLKVVGTAREEETVRHAIDDFVWPVDTSGFTVVVEDPEALPPGTAGTYVYPDNVINISRSVVDDPLNQQTSYVLAHEVGHMFDEVYMDAAGRAQFLAMRGFAPGSDWVGANLAWNARPMEDFAEVYAAFDVPSSGMPVSTEPGPLRNPAQIKALIERYQLGPARGTSLKVGTALSVVRETAGAMRSDPDVTAVLLGLAVVCAVFGAGDSIGFVPYRESERKRRAAMRVVRHHRLRHHGA